MWHKISQVPHIRNEWVGGWDGVYGVGGGLRLPLRHNGTSCCGKGAINGPQTTLQGKADHLITFMDDWEQLHTIATLLNLPSIATVFSELYKTIKSHLEKQTWLSIVILLWCLDSVQV